MNISVVCPTYNSALFINATVKSILKQTRLPDEVLFIDDGSTDNTLELLLRFKKNNNSPIKVIIKQNTHKGPGAARNSGIRLASGDWIAFIDSDDIWCENKLLEVEKVVKSNHRVNFISHKEIIIKKNGKQKSMDYAKKYNKNIPLFDQLYSSNIFSTSAVVCKKELLAEHGFFDELLLSAQDYDLWIKLSSFITPFFINKNLGFYIERPGNITSGNLLKRMKNEIHIALKYKTNLSSFLKRIFKIILSFIKQIIERIISR